MGGVRGPVVDQDGVGRCDARPLRPRPRGDFGLLHLKCNGEMGVCTSSASDTGWCRGKAWFPGGINGIALRFARLRARGTGPAMARGRNHGPSQPRPAHAATSSRRPVSQLED
jgi:hypothetical protein